MHALRPVMPLKDAPMCGLQLKRSQRNEQSCLFEACVQYCKTSGKIEINLQNAVSTIVDSCGPNSQLVFATAVGGPKSGKTEALNRLLRHWNKKFNSILFPTRETSNVDICGISLMFNDHPKKRGSDVIFLICLDVFATNENEQGSIGYNRLMEVCYRMSNIIIFTFSRHTLENGLVNMNYDRSDIVKTSISLTGYPEWELISPFHVDVLHEDFLNYVYRRYGAPERKKVGELLEALFGLLPKTALPVSVQFDLPFRMYCDQAKSSQANKGIYHHILRSLRSTDFRKMLITSSGVGDAFEKIVTGVNPVSVGGSHGIDNNGELSQAIEVAENNGYPKNKPFGDFAVATVEQPGCKLATGDRPKYSLSQTDNTIAVQMDSESQGKQIKLAEEAIHPEVLRIYDVHQGGSKFQNVPKDSLINPKSVEIPEQGTSSINASYSFPAEKRLLSPGSEDSRREFQDPSELEQEGPAGSGTLVTPTPPILNDDDNDTPGGQKAWQKHSPSEPVAIVPPKSAPQVLDQQIRASFKELAIRIITEFKTIAASAQRDTSQAYAFQKVLEWKQSWEVLAPSSQVLAKCDNVLRDCCLFFSSGHKTMNKFFGSRSYLDKDHLDAFAKEVKMSFETRTKELEKNDAHMFNFAQQVMNSILSSICGKNWAIIKAEQLLVETLCKSALEAYHATMHEVTTKRIFNQVEILTYQKSVVGAVLRQLDDYKHDWLWKPQYENVKTQMEEDAKPISLRNASNLTLTRKATKPAFAACQLEFDRMFVQKREFTSMADLKSHANSCRLAALKKAEAIITNHNEHAHVKEMLRRFAFAKMLKCSSSSCDRASEVLADKGELTVILKDGQLVALKAKVFADDVDLISLRFWLKYQQLYISDARFAKFYEKRLWSTPEIEHRNSVPLQECQNEVITNYFIQVKDYFLTRHNLLPATVTVEGQLRSLHFERITAAIRLALLPEPNIYSKAVAHSEYEAALAQEKQLEPPKLQDDLEAIKTRSMVFQNILYEQDSLAVRDAGRRTITYSGVSIASATRRSYQQNAETKQQDLTKLTELIEQLEEGLHDETSPVHHMVAKQAGMTLEKAKGILENQDVSLEKLQLMIKEVQIWIEAVNKESED